MVGRSASRISRIESGRVANLSLPELSRVSAAVGLKLYVTAYPAGRRPLDAPQLQLLASFNGRLHPVWERTMEAPVPIQGDLRAVDELIRNGECSCAVEAYTRIADVQLQARAARLKQRDIGADRLVLLVKASRANREVLRAAGPMLTDDFPIGTRAAMEALAAGRDPGGDCLVLL